MASIIKKGTYVFADVRKNSNKVWKIELYDDGRVITYNCRIGKTDVKNDLGNRGSSFYDRKVREKLKKGYTEAQVVADGETKVTNHSNRDLKTLAKQQIQHSHAEVADLIERLADYNIHQITSATNITFNTNTGLFSTPLGIVLPTAITEARLVLSDIKDFVDGKTKDYDLFLDNVNKFLRLVPQEVPHKLDAKDVFGTNEKIQKQNDVLDSLETSFSLLGQQTPDDTPQPVAEEKLFDLTIDLVTDRKDIERIAKFYGKTRQSMHSSSRLRVKRVFKLTIPLIQKRYEAVAAKIGGVMELWHGTKKSNILSILKSNLKVSPPATANITGKMFGNGVYFSDQSSKSLNYCVDPSTKVLTSELNWVEAGSLKKGDKLIAFDENRLNIQGAKGRATTRRWREAQVLDAGRAILPCVKIVFENEEELIVSENHQILFAYEASKAEWALAKNLKVGQRVPKYVSVWEKGNSYEDGWLAGFFDGEGYVNSGGESAGIGASQLPGPVFDYLVNLLKKRVYENWTVSRKPSGNSPTHLVYLKKSFGARLRFLGEIQPRRLIKNYLSWLWGKIFQAESYTRIKSIEFLGEKEVVTLGTTTKTFLTNGYASHNSYGYWDGSRDNNCFMFLANVAMGKYFTPKGYGCSGPPAGYDSVFAEGGKSNVMNNEMIVYKDDRFVLTYLIEFCD